MVFYKLSSGCLVEGLQALVTLRFERLDSNSRGARE